MKNAYTHVEIDHDVFITPSSFYTAKTTYIPKGPVLVLILQKSLYGLKTSGRNFYAHFKNILIKYNLELKEAIPCRYLLEEKERIVRILMTFVDDIIIACEDKHWTTKHIKSIGENI